MSYRCFKRTSWRRNHSWPQGLEPEAVPADSCRTLARFDDRADARDWCESRNADRPRKDPARRLAGMYEFISE